MKILTFAGSSPAEAFKKVQAELGDEAVIIETKELQKKALVKTALYELVVGIDDEKIVKQPRLNRSKPIQTHTHNHLNNTAAPTRKQSNRDDTIKKKSSDVYASISEAAKQISAIAEVTNEDSLTSPKKIAEPYELKEIRKEMSKLGDKVKLMQSTMWEEKGIDLPIPPEFAEIYKLSVQSGMDQKHLDDIMHLTLEHMPLKMRENTVTVKRYFQTLLRKMVPIRQEKPLLTGQKKVIMVVGPTGVGKTTSTAKLAARYSYLLDKKYKVGLIVLDTYRIGAVEQLMQYARMMKLGIETVVDPPEFMSALRTLDYCDYILIDTMGSSPYDKNKIEKIQECLETNSDEYNIDVVLTLPSSIKYDDLKVNYDNFSTLGVDTIMFTKLDETQGFGNVFSLAYETKKPISYFSVGQEVPEDLSVASSEFLVECLLHGYNRSKA